VISILKQYIINHLSTFKVKSLFFFMFFFLYFLLMFSFISLSMGSYFIFLLNVFYKIAILRHSWFSYLISSIWITCWWLEKLKFVSWILELVNRVLDLFLIIISTKLAKMPDSWSLDTMSKCDYAFSMLLVTYELALINGSILKDMRAIPFPEVVIEVTIVNATIRPDHFTSTILLIHMPGSFICTTIGPWESALTTHVIPVPLTFIGTFIRVYQYAKAMKLSLVVVPYVTWSIRPFFLSLSF